MSYTIADIERLLFKLYPAYDAESWDRCGLQVGDRRAQVKKIAFSLNASVHTIDLAKQAGANLLVAHHPICIDMPFPLSNLESGAHASAAAFYKAIQEDMHVISMHTNLDRSKEGAYALARSLGFEPKEPYEQRYLPGKESWGRLGALVELEEPISLSELHERSWKRFNRRPMSYGDPQHSLKRILFLGGSLGSFADDAASRGIDAVVTGECSFHRAHDLKLSGVAVSVLGHDLSEMVLIEEIKKALMQKHVPSSYFVDIDEGLSWWQ